jgi:hypothetical protein
MPGPGIAIQISGNTAGVEKMLLALDTAINPVAIAGFLGAVVDPYLRKRAGARFASEGDETVGAWAPLAEATQDIRDSQGYGAAHPINKREGELERFITQQDGGVQIHPFGATLTLPGAKPQGKLADKFEGAQQGGVGPSGRPYPARSVLALGEQDLVFVLTALAQHVEHVGKANL